MQNDRSRLSDAIFAVLDTAAESGDISHEEIARAATADAESWAEIAPSSSLWAFAITDHAATYDDPLEAASDHETRTAYRSAKGAMVAAEAESIDRLDGGGEYTRSEWAGADDKGRWWQTAEGHWGGIEWEITLEVWPIAIAE